MMGGGGGGDTTITNWSGMQDPLGQGVQYGINQVWMNQQANANQWAAQAKANDDAWRAQVQSNVDAWNDQQSEWRIAWAVAQAAYAAAQTLLANNALKASEDAADKQYDLGNRQMEIAESEYARYTAHFAPCENATVDAECARPEYTEPIDDEATRAAVEIRVQFANSRAQLNRRRNRYCLGAAVALERTLTIEEAKAVGQAKERTRRYLEDRQFNRQQIYFNRKMSVLSLGRGIPSQSIQAIGSAANDFARGADMELAARNQFYGAILQSFGRLEGAFLPTSASPTGFGSTQGTRMGSSIGGSSFSSVSNFGAGFGGAGMMGPGGLGYGFGASNGATSWDANMTGGSSTFA